MMRTLLCTAALLSVAEALQPPLASAALEPATTPTRRRDHLQFVHIPKNAGSTMEDVELPGRGATSSEGKFALVRNPWRSTGTFRFL